MQSSAISERQIDSETGWVGVPGQPACKSWLCDPAKTTPSGNMVTHRKCTKRRTLGKWELFQRKDNTDIIISEFKVALGWFRLTMRRHFCPLEITHFGDIQQTSYPPRVSRLAAFRRKRSPDTTTDPAAQSLATKGGNLKSVPQTYYLAGQHNSIG